MTENDPILDVYERFKHLDRPISEAGQDEDPFHKTCAALWVAVKKHRAQAKVGEAVGAVLETAGGAERVRSEVCPEGA